MIETIVSEGVALVGKLIIMGLQWRAASAEQAQQLEAEADAAWQRLKARAKGLPDAIAANNAQADALAAAKDAPKP